MDPLSKAAAGADQQQHPLSAQAQTLASRLTSKLAALRTGRPDGTDAHTGSLSPLSLSDDDVSGVERLAPDPDSPTSRLLEQAARQSLEEAASRRGTPEKFSFSKDIARNPDLARAARAELLGSFNAAEGGDSSLGSMQRLQHDAEIDRQTAVIDLLDRDAKQESTINQELASVILGRVQSARQATEHVLGVLQAFAGAEAAYGRAMDAASLAKLVGEGDGPSLRAAMETVTDLPMMLAASHKQLASKLSETIKGVQVLLQDVRAACEEVMQGAATAKRSVDSSRRALKTALAAHQEACRSYDAAMGEPARGVGGGSGGRRRPLDLDPWLTEGRLVEQQALLQRAQHSERQYLAKAFQRVGDLEGRRAGGLREAFSSVLQLYRTEWAPLQSEAGVLEAALDAVDPERDLESFWSAASNAVRTGASLSDRQTHTLDQIARELMASPHILRQGPMDRWEGGRGRWVTSHFVLTQAGFLHWCDEPSPACKPGPAARGAGAAADPEAAAGAGGGRGGEAEGREGGSHVWGGPTRHPVSDTLNLARSSFEQGEAPVFRIIEVLPSISLFGGKTRTCTLKADSIESCMDWAIVLREAITESGGR